MTGNGGSGRLGPAAPTACARHEPANSPLQPAFPCRPTGSRTAQVPTGASPAPAFTFLLPTHSKRGLTELGCSGEENRHNLLPSWRHPKVSLSLSPSQEEAACPLAHSLGSVSPPPQWAVFWPSGPWHLLTIFPLPPHRPPSQKNPRLGGPASRASAATLTPGPIYQPHKLTARKLTNSHSHTSKRECPRGGGLWRWSRSPGPRGFVASLASRPKGASKDARHHLQPCTLPCGPGTHGRVDTGKSPLPSSVGGKPPSPHIHRVLGHLAGRADSAELCSWAQGPQRAVCYFLPPTSHAPGPGTGLNCRI